MGIEVSHTIETPPAPAAAVRRVRGCPTCGTPTSGKWCGDPACWDETDHERED